MKSCQRCSVFALVGAEKNPLQGYGVAGKDIPGRYTLPHQYRPSWVSYVGKRAHSVARRTGWEDEQGVALGYKQALESDKTKGDHTCWIQTILECRSLLKGSRLIIVAHICRDWLSYV